MKKKYWTEIYCLNTDMSGIQIHIGFNERVTFFSGTNCAINMRSCTPSPAMRRMLSTWPRGRCSATSSSLENLENCKSFKTSSCTGIVKILNLISFFYLLTCITLLSSIFQYQQCIHCLLHQT